MQNQSTFSREAMIYARIEALLNQCFEIEKNANVLSKEKLEKLLSREIEDVKNEVSELTGEGRDRARSLVYNLEGRAHFAIATAPYVDSMDRESHLYKARTCANSALSYEKNPLAYFLLGDVLQQSGRKTDAAVAFRKVIESGDSKLSGPAMEAIGRLGVSFNQLETASQSETAAFGAKRKINWEMMFTAAKWLGGGILIRMLFVNSVMLNISIGCFVIALLCGLLAYFNET